MRSCHAPLLLLLLGAWSRRAARRRVLRPSRQTTATGGGQLSEHRRRQGHGRRGHAAQAISRTRRREGSQDRVRAAGGQVSAADDAVRRRHPRSSRSARPARGLSGAHHARTRMWRRKCSAPSWISLPPTRASRPAKTTYHSYFVVRKDELRRLHATGSPTAAPPRSKTSRRISRSSTTRRLRGSFTTTGSAHRVTSCRRSISSRTTSSRWRLDQRESHPD